MAIQLSSSVYKAVPPKFVYTGTGSNSGSSYRLSSTLVLTPGNLYRFTVLVDASKVLSGTPGISLSSSDGSTVYATAVQNAGSIGAVGFTVLSTVTTAYLQVQLNNCTVANGQLLTWSGFIATDITGSPDLANVSLRFSRTTSDATSGTEVTVSGLSRGRTLSDATNGSDAITVRRAKIARISDFAGGADNPPRTLRSSRTAADTAQGTDTVTRKDVSPKSASDTAAASDSPTIKVGHSRNYLVDSLLKKAPTVSYSVDARFKLVPVVNYHVDALAISRVTVHSVVDADLLQTRKLFYGIDVLLRTPIAGVSYSIDAYLGGISSNSYLVDASLINYTQTLRLVTSVDAVLSVIPGITWWDRDYPYRRRLVVTGYGQAGRPADAPTDIVELVRLGKMRSDLADIEAVHFDPATNIWTVLGHAFIGNAIEFPLLDDVASGVSDEFYYIYYGNHLLNNAPTRPAYTALNYPDVASISDSHVTFVQPGVQWVNGFSNTRLSKVSFFFPGEIIQINANTGPTYGIAEVQIDNGPWVQADQYSKLDVKNAPVYTNNLLGTGTHYIHMRVSGVKNPSSQGTGINIVSFNYRNPITVDDTGEDSSLLRWGIA